MNLCHACGTPLKKNASGPAPKHCPPCRREHRRNLPSQIHRPEFGPRGAVCVCKLCGQDFVAATRIATVCDQMECRRKSKAERERDRLEANAEAGNVCHCGRPVQAKGLCRTHYTKSHRAANGREVDRRVEVPCAGCGEPIMRRPSDLKTRLPTCGYSCRRAVTYGTPLPADHWARWYGKTSPWSPPWAGIRADAERRQAIAANGTSGRTWYVGACRECGATFTSDQPQCRTCSKRCAAVAGRQRRRARKKDAFVAPVYRMAIFDRDKWTCQLCGKKIKRNARAPHPLSPTIDHVIPIGDKRYKGTHEPANAQAAHFICNSRKGAGGGGEQLALIG